MVGRAEPGREYLRMDDEGGGVGLKVGEEEGDRVEHNVADAGPQRGLVGVRDGKAKHEHGH